MTEERHLECVPAIEWDTGRRRPTRITVFENNRRQREGAIRGREWLGGRDSNPDYTVQSRVSYH